MYLLPKPQKMEVTQGNFYIPHHAEIAISSVCGQEVTQYAVMLREELEKSAGVGAFVKKKSGRGNAPFYLDVNQDWNEEEYALVIGAEGVLIEGGSSRGLLHGIQTLRQMLQQEGAVLTCMDIRDYPLMPNRGFYCDTTRGRIPTLAYLKTLVDKLSFYKMNQLQLYVEHSYLLDGCSEMWRDDTPLEAQDILELDAYCTQRGIELVPSLSLFGHLYKMLRTKKHAHLGELPDKADAPFSFIGRQEHHTLNVMLEESFERVKSMMEEYLPLFTSRKFNIGADETFDLGKGAGREAAERDGIKGMYIGFVKKICTYLVEKGRESMFWGDVICGFPELISELPEETVCLNWGYAWNQSEDSAKALYEAGATQYVCPGALGWNQFINLIGNSYSNISRMCAYGEKYNAIGVLNTDWGDFGHFNHPEASMIGLIYGAALSWNREGVPQEEMDRRISLIEYRDKSEKIVEILAQLCTQSSFEWDTAVFFHEIQTGSIDWSKEQTDRYMEERRERIGTFAEKNQAIMDLRQKLGACVRDMDTDTRKAVRPFLVMSEGMRIFNSIGSIVSGFLFGGTSCPEADLTVLAERLECWFMEYKELWRSVSRESELFRIGNVIFWYADFLRK